MFWGSPIIGSLCERSIDYILHLCGVHRARHDHGARAARREHRVARRRDVVPAHAFDARVAVVCEFGDPPPCVVDIPTVDVLEQIKRPIPADDLRLKRADIDRADDVVQSSRGKGLTVRSRYRARQ